MGEPQALTVVKSEPLPSQASGAPLTVTKSEPLPATTPPPPPAEPGMWDYAKQFGRALFNTSDTGVSSDTHKVISGETAAGIAGGVGAGALVTAAAPEVAPVAGLAGVARAIPWAWRAASGAASIAGAGAGGGAEAALGEGKPLTGDQSQDTATDAAERQAALQAFGVSTGWLTNFAGRKLLGGTVGQQAVDWLNKSRLGHIEEVQKVLTAAQDAIDAHRATQAAARVGTQAATQGAEAEAARLRAQWPATEGLPPMKPVPAHAPAPAPTTAASPAGAVSSPAGASAAAPPPTLESVLADAQAAHQARTTAPPPPGRSGHFTLPKPSPAAQQYISQQLDRRDIALGRAPAPEGIAPPPAPLFAPKEAPATPPPNVPTLGPGETPAGRAAQMASDVVEGPAQNFHNQLGQAVEEAAKNGPNVDFRPIKAKAQAMFEHSQPGPVADAAAQGNNPNLGYFQNADQAREVLAKAGVNLTPDHPLPGVLAKIQSAPDTVSFEDAHRYKRMLDDAIGWKPEGTVQAPARGQLKGITKGVRGQIRTAMGGYEPYEQATAAYQASSTLMGPNGLARKIQATAQTNPEAIVNTLVKPSEPGKFEMLHQVLTQHAAQGGGPEGAVQGENAWHAVQSTVMYKHLIQPGIDKFDQSVAKMDPAFLRTLTGDPQAKGVFDRLTQMSEAVKAADAKTASIGAQAKVAQAKAGMTAAGLQRTQRVAQRQVQAAASSPVVPTAGEDQISRQLTDQEQAFKKSSLAKQAPASSQLQDLAYAALAPPLSPREAAGTIRLLSRGPKANDLIHWASLSDQNTQLWVKAISSNNPAQALAALGRVVAERVGVTPSGAPRMAVAHKQTPAAAAAVPPPGPPGG